MLRARILEIARFGVVGLINTGIDLALFSIAFYWLGLPLLVSNTLAYCLATINSYVMNKYWTFAGRGSPQVSKKEFTRFFLFNVVGLLLSNLAVWTFARFVAPIVAKLLAVGVTFVWNYLTIRRFVFRDEHSNRNPAS